MKKREKKRNKKGQNKQILRPIIPKITLTLKRKREKKIGKEQGGRKEEAKAIMIIPFVSYILAFFGDSFIKLLKELCHEIQPNQVIAKCPLNKINIRITT